MHLRIGSRGSQLALWQANHIASHLKALGHTTEVIIIRTTGDKLQHITTPLPPSESTKGLFTKEIEEALLANSIDLAVHSLKDLPTELDPRFTLAAIPPRADARDALLAPEWIQLHTLPDNARVGTTSPRRKAQIHAHRPDIRFIELRGNIDTRIRKLAAGECDAIILACAGLDRLGTRLLSPVALNPLHPEFDQPGHLECVTHADHDHLDGHEIPEAPGQRDWIRQRFDADILCPAPGQGALGIETLAANAQATEAIAALDDAATRYAVEAERAVLHALGGGCSLPVGAYFTNGTLHANVTAPHGDEMIYLELPAITNEPAYALGARVAAELKQRGALDLLSENHE